MNYGLREGVSKPTETIAKLLIYQEDGSNMDKIFVSLSKWRVNTFFPFFKVYHNDMNERCVLVELDDKEQLVPLAQIHKKKYRVVEVGIIKPYSKMPHMVLNMNVDELKL